MAEQSEIEPDAEVMALVHAIEDAGRGYNINLTKLVDGMTEYTMVYRGNTTVHDDIDDAHELRQRLAEQEKAEAAARILEQVRIAARERAIEDVKQGLVAAITALGASDVSEAMKRIGIAVLEGALDGLTKTPHKLKEA